MAKAMYNSTLHITDETVIYIITEAFQLKNSIEKVYQANVMLLI